MADLDLRKLWKLHLVDHQLADIRQRAATLDPGRKIQGELAALTAKHDAQLAHVKSMIGDQTDIELQQKSIDDKLKKMDKELYSGKVVNPKEVAAMQQEIAHQKTVRGDLDVRLLELWEAVPPAKKEEETTAGIIAEKKKELAEFQKKVMASKTQLEKEFKDRSEFASTTRQRSSGHHARTI